MTAVLLLAAASLGCPPDRPPQVGPPRAYAPSPSPVGLLAWPRMRAADFGCLLQTRFGARDPAWGCARPDPGPIGDPCGATRAYYDGPTFPAAAAGALGPEVVEVRLAWEHRDLQAVTVVLHGDLDAATARHRLGLPPPDAPLPPNVQGITVQRCGVLRTCVALVGFDHLGAGDVECPH